jgi:hypothetical protein
MNIPDTVREIKGSLGEKLKVSLSHEIFVILLIILVALASFGLGRLSALEGKRVPVRIEGGNQSATLQGGQTSSKVAPSAGNLQTTLPGNESLKSYVASRSGKKYYAPWCTAVKRIADTNKVWFASREEAESKGYTPASNCKGM